MSAAHLEIRVQAEPFQAGEEYESFLAGNTTEGAFASFVGRVRDFNTGSTVHTLELEHYPGMTEQVIQAIAQEAAQRWPIAAARIIHRYGKLFPGDNIVLVLTSSAHRHAAQDACAYIMDHLKTRATFWKKEQTPDGSHWVQHRQSDDDALSRWEIDAS